MDKSQIKKLIEILSQKRPLFHNEADFQHEIALLIQANIKPSFLRLERVFNLLDSRKFILDIYIKKNGKRIGIELKYKTKKLEIEVKKEKFLLSSHNANGVARFDFIKDIERLEILKRINEDVDSGFVILLTNDEALFSENKDKSENYKPIYLYPGRSLSGEITWGTETSITKVGKKRIAPIMLYGSYTIEWDNFSHIDNNVFKYTIIEI